MPRGGVPSHSKHFCTLNPKVFGFHVSMQMGKAQQGHFHAKSIWYAGLTTRIMFMIEKAFSCPPRSSLRIGNLLRAIFGVRRDVTRFGTFMSFTPLCCLFTFTSSSHDALCTRLLDIPQSLCRQIILYALKKAVFCERNTFVAIHQQPIHFRSPEEKLVEKTFWSGYWLRSYWFYCVTVGLELQLLRKTTAPMLSKVIRMVKRSCKSLGRIPNAAFCRRPTPTSPADNSLRSLAMPVANQVSFYSYCVGTAELFKKGCYNVQLSSISQCLKVPLKVFFKLIFCFEALGLEFK